MTKFKKLAMLCTAFLATISLGALASCGVLGGKTSETESSASTVSSVEDLSSSVESESSLASESGSSEESSSSVVNSSSEDSSSAKNSSVNSEDSSSSQQSSVDTSSSEDSSSDVSSSDVSSSDDSSSEDSSSDDSSSDDSSSSSSSSYEDWEDDGSCVHVWSEWELVEEPSCTVDGVKVRYCLHNDEHVNYGSIAMRGHDYGDEAVCVRCSIPVSVSTDHSGAVYTQVEDCETHGDSSQAKGSEWNRYELTEGYYSIEALRAGIWISVSVDGAGQYALYTIGGAGKVEIIRYDASAQYINPKEHPAVALDDDNVISVVNCGDAYWSPSWRATWKIRADRAETIEFVIEKIDDPAWQPAYVKTNVIAQQINGVRAPEGPENTVLAEVPYDAEYYLDTELGYYRLGTPENPGEIIYAAITKVPPRMLYDRPFTEIEYQGPNLTLGDGWGFGEAFTVDGDYNLLYYPSFIMNDSSYGGTPGNCYQDFVNSDGVYPVNEELFKFLNLYAFNKRPFDETITSEDFMNKADFMWLAACYYYANLTPGTEEYPMELSTGNNTVHIPNLDFFYANFKGDGYYTISCETEGVILTINDQNVYSPFAVTICTDPYGGKNFTLSAADFIEMDAALTIEKASGLLNYTFSNDAGVDVLYLIPDADGNMTVSTIQVFDSEVLYFAHYCYDVTEVGLYTFTVNTEIMFQIDGIAPDADGNISIAVTEEYLAEGMPIQIYIMANADTSVDVKVSYSSEIPEDMLPQPEEEESEEVEQL